MIQVMSVTGLVEIVADKYLLVNPGIAILENSRCCECVVLRTGIHLITPLASTL